MKIDLSISIFLFFIVLLTSCNSNERKFKEFNTRIENLTLLSESLNSDNNDYLNSLIDSTKIIKNEYTIIKLDPEYKNQLEEKINVITSQLKRKIANNCVLNRTFEIQINNLVDWSSYKIRLDFLILKGNKCEARLNIYDLNGRSITDIIDYWAYVPNFQFKFKSNYEEDYYLIKFLNENKWDYSTHGDKKVLLNYTLYNDSTFKINIDNYPYLLKVKDLKDCECELTRSINTKSRERKDDTKSVEDLQRKIDNYNQLNNNQSSNGDN